MASKKTSKKSAAQTAMKYHTLKQKAIQERTRMGLVGRQSVKQSKKMKDLFKDNYTSIREADLLQQWFPAKRPNDRKVVVAITAHDDDLLSFCGTFAHLADACNCEIHHIILTDGSMGCGEAALREFASEKELRDLSAALVKQKQPKADPGYYVRGSQKVWKEYAELLRKGGKLTSEIRQGEARDAEKILGFHNTYFLDFQDAALGQYNFGLTTYDNAGAMAVAMRLVRDINPDLMVLQDRNQVIDFNPDHYAAGMIGYTIYWHLQCPVLGVDPIEKPFKAVIQRGFEGIGRPEFRFCDWLVTLSDGALKRKFDCLYAYKNQLDLLEDLLKVEEQEKFRAEGFFDVDLPPALIG